MQMTITAKIEMMLIAIRILQRAEATTRPPKEPMIAKSVQDCGRRMRDS